MTNRTSRTSMMRLGRYVVVILLGLQLTACSLDDVVGTPEPPSDINDPAATRTPAGALAAYRGVLAQFRKAVGGEPNSETTGYVATSGLLGDELQSAADLGGLSFGSWNGLDIRRLPEALDPAQDPSSQVAAIYSQLQRTRGQSLEALGLLRDFAPISSPALRGHLYAVQGYSEIMLAELFCSGIPLSTVDYDGDYTLKPGSSTADVFAHALALFDTALTLSADSARILNLAHIGRGRALLGLGRVAEAAQAVAAVPDGFRYEVGYSAVTALAALNFAHIRPNVHWAYSVGDQEGGNGLDYRTSGDPRTAAVSAGTNNVGIPLYHPAKYARDGSSSIVLADWVEARLIQAEAALAAGGDWLGTLNLLRQTAITPALPDLTDPGTPESRVDLLFRERAAWLFLTGHRQGDLRRLIRQYGRRADLLYPIGAYPGGSAFYGGDVTAPIPAAERVSNLNFIGCLNRGA